MLSTPAVTDCKTPLCGHEKRRENNQVYNKMKHYVDILLENHFEMESGSTIRYVSRGIEGLWEQNKKKDCPKMQETLICIYMGSLSYALLNLKYVEVMNANPVLF